MKIERRITANRFETNSRARKLRNSSSVKLATFPSLFSFSFLLSLSLSPSLSLSLPPLFIFSFYFRTLPVSRDAYTNFSSLSLSLETVLLPSPPFFPSYASFVTPPLPLALRPRAPSIWSMLFFPANERAQARGFARSLYPRSFGSIPAGNVNTLSTAAKVVASHRVVAHVISYNLYKSLGTLIEIIRILDSYRIFYLLFKNLKRVSEIETFESWNKSTEGKLFVIVLIN